MFKDFIAYLCQFHPIEELTPQINQCLTRVTFPKKYIVVPKGTTCNYVYFLEKGLMRSYYTHNNVDITTWVLHEQQFVTAIQSFYSRDLSKEVIETLEPCVAVMIHYDDVMKFCLKSHSFTLCMFKMFQQYNMVKDSRNYFLRSLSAGERYEALCLRDPELIRRTSSKVIASYLNISQETLSRIRKNYREQNKQLLCYQAENTTKVIKEEKQENSIIS
jgi:CRP-like cAMP-binding protein